MTVLKHWQLKISSDIDLLSCLFQQLGFGDMVTCFQCGFVYKNWSSDADPIIIHSNHKSDCDFISDLRERGILSCENFITNTDTSTVSISNGKS